MNDAFMRLEAINATKTKITAKINIDCNTDDVPIKKTVTVKTGDDLYKLSNERETYREGFIITEIDAANAMVSFSNGIQIAKGQTKGGMNEEILQFMIRKTIEEQYFTANTN